MYTEKLVCDRLIMAPPHYQGAKAYARAKRALTVLSELWAEQWRKDGIIVNAMHPGWADTPGVASALPTFRSITRRILRTSEEGADTIIWLAKAKEAGGLSGRLFLDREPRTPYLLSKTQEPAAQRAQLEAFIDAQIEAAQAQ
jgi:NAD(P)-dependent dehydrogenase (short-subunit alcohol dehydrogenase family)